MISDDVKMAEKQKIRDFLLHHLNDADIPGLEWLDRFCGVFLFLLDVVRNNFGIIICFGKVTLKL